MTNESARSTVIRTIPSRRLYWAVLEVPAECAGRRAAHRLVRSRSPVLSLMLADWVPASTEALASAFVAVDDRRIAACCCDRTEAVEALRRGVIELVPDGLPGFIGAAAPALEPGDFNLLNGALEPPALKLPRRVACASIAVAAAAAAALVWHGAERRLERDGRSLVELAAAAGDRDLAEVRAEVSRLERVTAGRPGRDGERDAGVALAALLGCWPSGAAVRVESISVGPAAIAVNALAAGPSDVEVLVAALRDVRGWTMVQPQASAAGGQTRLNLRWLRALPAESGGEAP